MLCPSLPPATDVLVACYSSPDGWSCIAGSVPVVQSPLGQHLPHASRFPFSTTMVVDRFPMTYAIRFSCNELVNFGDDYNYVYDQPY